MDRDDRVIIYDRVIIAQTQKIGRSQVVASHEDVCDHNGKPSTPISLLPATYCQKFYAEYYHHKISHIHGN